MASCTGIGDCVATAHVPGTCCATDAHGRGPPPHSTDQPPPPPTEVTLSAAAAVPGGALVRSSRNSSSQPIGARWRGPLRVLVSNTRVGVLIAR
jgi:hypothetical protein